MDASRALLNEMAWFMGRHNGASISLTESPRVPWSVHQTRGIHRSGRTIAGARRRDGNELAFTAQLIRHLRPSGGVQDFALADSRWWPRVHERP